MSVRLVILGLLRGEPLHGYEIKHIIEKHMGDWTNIPFGSIYFALGKLKEEGRIEESAVSKDGKRPAKTVFAITKEGREEFLRLLRETLGSTERQFYEIDLGLAFMDCLDPTEAAALFHGRVLALEAAVEALRAHEAEQMRSPDLPPSAKAIFSHGLAHREAELTWAREVLARIESGGLAKSRA
jgi:DNA-binding PadR family transcriptional regulator